MHDAAAAHDDGGGDAEEAEAAVAVEARRREKMEEAARRARAFRLQRMRLPTTGAAIFDDDRTPPNWRTAQLFKPFL